MPDAFDAYHKWLGIPPNGQPANHYRLLGIDPLESDTEVITRASEQRKEFVETFRRGEHRDSARKILRELGDARLCLLDAKKKAAYDGLLRGKPGFRRSARPPALPTGRFDPYHAWLGIAAEDQPPNFYRLLNIEQFEPDKEVIGNAADVRMGYVRKFQRGKHSQDAQRIRNEISTARLCLLDAKRKADYDRQLREGPAEKPVLAQIVEEPVVAQVVEEPVVAEIVAEIVEQPAAAVVSARRSFDFAKLAGVPLAAVLALTRAVDRFLARIAGRNNLILHGFLRVVAIVVPSAAVAVSAGWLWNPFSGASSVPQERDRVTTNEPDGAVRANASQLICAERLGVPIEWTNSIGMKMVLIPSGDFMMGSPRAGGDAEPNEKPQHRVRITKAFYLGVHEVTQEQYEQIMGSNPSRFKGDPQRPVEMVSWENATEFCRQLSQQDGKTYRLPTEAEWEYACRAATTTQFASGDDEPSLGRYGWYLSNSSRTTHPVGKKKANAWGLFDVHGNVYEWCQDWCDTDYYENSPANDPRGPASGSQRIARGGGWNSQPEYCRSAARNWTTPGDSSPFRGFRVVLVPDHASGMLTDSSAQPVEPAVYTLSVYPPEAQAEVSGEGATVEGSGATRTITVAEPDGQAKVVVTVTLDGYEPAEQEIRPQPGESRRLVLRLEPVTPPHTISQVNPSRNVHTAPPATNLSVTCKQSIDSTSLSHRTFVVHAMQTGRLHESSSRFSVSRSSRRSFSLDPVGRFHPGEMIQATATTKLHYQGGKESPGPFVWQFRASAVGGPGRFSDSGQTLGNSDSRAVALGDLDGDGDIDAYVGNWDSQPNRVWLNDGQGRFADSGQKIGHSSSYGVALGDLNGDGRLDAFVANEQQPNRVWFNDGQGTFTDNRQRLGNSHSYAVALSDLDGDGDLDAFVANWDRQPNRVWLNDGHGRFSDSDQRLGRFSSRAVALGDLDHDGDIDAFVGNNGASGVWMNDGRGFFRDTGQWINRSMTKTVALGDLDGDGDLDAFVGNKLQPNKVWLNDGKGQFTDRRVSLGLSSSYGAALGDVDGDGDLDAFVANSDGQPNRNWLNDGQGRLADTTTRPLGTSSSYAIALADLDGDGDLDAFLANKGNQPNRVWLNERPVAGVSEPAPSSAASQKILTNSIGMKLVEIPAGEFMMGSSGSDDDGRSDEKPQHRVRITKPFYLGMYEVAQAEYKWVMGKNPSHFQAPRQNLWVDFVAWQHNSRHSKPLHPRWRVVF